MDNEALFVGTCASVAIVSLRSLFIPLCVPGTKTLQTRSLVLGADNRWLLFLICDYKSQPLIWLFGTESVLCLVGIHPC